MLVVNCRHNKIQGLSFCPFLLTIIVSFLLLVTTSAYPFDIFKHYLQLKRACRQVHNPNRDIKFVGDQLCPVVRDRMVVGFTTTYAISHYRH